MITILEGNKGTFQKGSILIILLIMVATIQIALYKARPLMSTKIKREKEIQLKFILKEFKKGILRYKRFNNRFPSKIEDLVKSPHPRYIRQLYTDPFTGKNEWDIVHDKSGIFIVDLMSKSSEKSLSGIEYKRFAFNDELDFKPRIPEKLGAENDKGQSEEITH